LGYFALLWPVIFDNGQWQCVVAPYLGTQKKETSLNRYLLSLEEGKPRMRTTKRVLLGAQSANTIVVVLIAAALFGALALPAVAQEVLPYPQQPFKGKIGRAAKESTPDFPKGIEAPKGAPNVLLILTDDVGFGASSTFGGPIQTPNFQRLADSGLRYTMFHTTALCSPTRAPR
jgi:Sulfatase